MLTGILIGAAGASVIWGIAYFRLVHTVQKVTLSMKAKTPELDDGAMREMEKRWQ